ncbi:MAG TPA: hypothetical protein PLU26_01375 [Candidatus Competibacter sp.]|nr:hypothetical protein [Candidatus Competibacter sp.]
MLVHKIQKQLRRPVASCWRCGLAALLAGVGLALAAGPAQAAWTAAITKDPLTRESRCLLLSDTQTISDGYEQTPVSLVFNGASLLVVTGSELDGSFADLQLVVNDEPPLRSNKITPNKMILNFDQNVPDLLQRLREGRQATVYLRFWPTWPATQAYPVSFSLIGFSKAHDAFNQGCRSVGPSSAG